MRLTLNGDSVPHIHECAPERKGQRISTEELHELALKAIMEEYQISNISVKSIGGSGKADFQIQSSTGTINIKLFLEQEFPAAFYEFDQEWMLERYHKYGEYPRIALAYPYCQDTQDDNRMIPCGGTYVFTYSMHSIIPQTEYDDTATRELSPLKLADKFAQAWIKLDAGTVMPYLRYDFHYSSEWVFDELPCRHEYEPYFRRKLDSIRRNGGRPQVTIVRERTTKEFGLLMKQGDVVTLLKLRISNGRILKAMMTKPTSEYEIVNPNNTLGQIHGDHLSAIFGDEPIKDAIGDVCQGMTMDDIIRTNVTDGEMKNRRTFIYYGSKGEGDIRIQTISAMDLRSNNVNIISAYPLLKGHSYDVKIERVIEWDNQVEATVLCSIGDFEFAFFATDYAANKWRYKKSHILNVSLSALAYTLKESKHALTLAPKAAAEFLAKIGNEPIFDENGNPSSLDLSLMKMVSFRNRRRDYPDEAEFHSPCGPIEHLEYYNSSFCRTEITINRAEMNSEPHEEDVTLPLYFRSELLPYANEGIPLCGWLWISGTLTQNIEHACGLSETASQIFADTADRLLIDMQLFDVENIDNLNALTAKFDKLEIRHGYELDAFGVRTSDGRYLKTYMPAAGSEIRWNGTEPYMDNMYIHGYYPEKTANEIKQDVLSYVSSDYTPKALAQTWLMNNLSYFMHVIDFEPSMLRDYIVYPEKVDEIFIQPLHADSKSPFFKAALKAIGEYGSDNLMPRLSMDIKNRTAILQYCYWSRLEGLIRVTEHVEYENGHFSFSIISTENVQ